MKIKNGLSCEKNGWLYISVYGNPKDRGYAYGFLSAKRFGEIQQMLNFFILETYGETWKYMIKLVNDDFKTMTEKEYPELYEEMQGIAEGCTAGGTETTVDEIIAWNYYYSISYWFPFITGASNIKTNEARIGKEGGARDRCSAIIATGKDWTEDGKIVVAHNSFCDFIDGQYSNIMLDIKPDKGYRILMQTCPCWIWSGSDFFVTSKGIVGTETTIGGFSKFEKKIPIGYRIRTAMQYGDDIDEYVEILLKGNGGDYANSWLFGDINTNEIIRVELGLNYYAVDRTKNGYFIGFNSTYDARIRNLEVVNSGFYDIRRHQGARKVRLTELIEKYKGNINVENAKLIIADHYDVYLEKDNNPCSRTVCSHYYLDNREYMCQIGRPVPYSPHGAVDGIVTDSNLIKNMSLIGRWGNSCGMPFIKDEFMKKHIQWGNIAEFINDRPTQEWTVFSITKNKSRPLFTKKKKESKTKTKKNISKSEDDTNTSSEKKSSSTESK
jgi:hypothetical protein